ncbi:hypothetical protein [Aeromicrobium terrae]|uniref:Uncharacterized protein n=1 Tax=Aeromicrobium terrae TaxID=2498846 RepID=A0A5C8NKW4_9ACTN|nr:hypothetical protein [Aeromicrobium terrae]TXL62359.1 hypothetical protein FHP06_06620 [Aeromicrobium terrae]
MSQDERGELHELLGELDQISPSADVLNLAAEWALPSELASFVGASSNDFPSVAPGQLWRLSWLGNQMLAVVLSQSSWWTRVAPLTTDVDLADEYTLLIDPRCTSLALQTATFLRASASVPTFTLAQYLGDVGQVEGRDAVEALLSLEVAMIDGTLRSDLSTGPMLAQSDWDRQEFLDSLQESMNWFEGAALSVLDDDGSIAGGSSSLDDSEADVSDLLRTSQDLPSLVEATGIAPGRLLSLKTGRAKPQGPEIEVLSSYFGSKVRVGHPENMRIAALELIAEPANRQLWLEAAQSSEAGAPLSPRKFLVDLIETPIAARTVYGPTSAPGNNATVEEWKRALRDRIAVRFRSES